MALAAVGVLVAGALVAVLTRPDGDGPLTNGEVGVVVHAFPAGATVTYGLQTLGNDDPAEEIRLVAVRVRAGGPAPRLLGEPALLGPERVDALGAGVFDVLAGWPPDGLAPTQVEGAVIPAGARSHLEVVVPLAVPDVAQGIGVIEGFTVEYEVAGRRYREDTRMMLVVCPAEDHRACDAFDPETYG